MDLSGFGLISWIPVVEGLAPGPGGLDPGALEPWRLRLGGLEAWLASGLLTYWLAVWLAGWLAGLLAGD